MARTALLLTGWSAPSPPLGDHVAGLPHDKTPLLLTGPKPRPRAPVLAQLPPSPPSLAPASQFVADDRTRSLPPSAVSRPRPSEHEHNLLRTFGGTHRKRLHANFSLQSSLFVRLSAYLSQCSGVIDNLEECSSPRVYGLFVVGGGLCARQDLFQQAMYLSSYIV